MFSLPVASGGSTSTVSVLEMDDTPVSRRLAGVSIRPGCYLRSNRSLFMTLTHAATKSSTNFPLASSCA